MLSLDKNTGLEADVIAGAFARALAAAEAYRGATSPNPPVGCVVLDAEGRELAVAAHQRAGEGHAEAQALALCAMSGTTARAHTIIVTLEPCNHTGRTPPCCDAILATPIRHVWIGAADPNTAVKGGGARRLAEAGLEVHWIKEIDSKIAARAEELVTPFAKRMRSGIPWVTVKQALDAKGSMIPPPGQKTFTSPASLLFAHELRKRADAIITGSGTVLADAPEFTVRRVSDHPGKIRDLLILDRRGRVPESYLAAAAARGFRARRSTSLSDALKSAAAAGAVEVLVEAGPAVTAHVLQSTHWDEHIIIQKSTGGAGRDAIERQLRGR